MKLPWILYYNFLAKKARRALGSDSLKVMFIQAVSLYLKLSNESSNNMFFVSWILDVAHLVCLNCTIPSFKWDEHDLQRFRQQTLPSLASDYFFVKSKKSNKPEKADLKVFNFEGLGLVFCACLIWFLLSLGWIVLIKCNTSAKWQLMKNKRGFCITLTVILIQ